MGGKGRILFWATLLHNSGAHSPGHKTLSKDTYEVLQDMVQSVQGLELLWSEPPL